MPQGSAETSGADDIMCCINSGSDNPKSRLEEGFSFVTGSEDMQLRPSKRLRLAPHVVSQPKHDDSKLPCVTAADSLTTVSVSVGSSLDLQAEFTDVDSDHEVCSDDDCDEDEPDPQNAFNWRDHKHAQAVL